MCRSARSQKDFMKIAKTFVAVFALLLLVGSGCYQTNRPMAYPTRPVPALKEKQTDPSLAVATHPDITVSSPSSGDTITSPLTVTGEARGTWYFEASFPIDVVDANNVVLGTGVAQAQSDWMTTNFVAYTATITFTTPSTATGEIVLKKDNPSGEPQNDDELRIPIVF